MVFKMRIPIREQLGLLILLSSLIGLAVVSIATWISNYKFVLSIRATRLSLTAALKAAQLASNLNLMQTSANFVTTRIVMQGALRRYNDGNDTQDNWVAALQDMGDAISGRGSVGQSLLLQSQILPRDSQYGTVSVMNVTSSAVNNTLRMPYNCPDGSPVYLGDAYCGLDLNLGYPPWLYPNLTYITEKYNTTFNISAAVYEGEKLGPDSVLLLGPYLVNSTFSLVSMTMPLINNTSAVDILGWLTVLMDASLIMEVLQSPDGLEKTGETLLVGPVRRSNKFSQGVMAGNRTSTSPNDFRVSHMRCMVL